MQYYEIFDLHGEPFSNSPDPDFFFESEGHRRVLHSLEIALRLRRGLNVVLGEVGTGKTTLGRRLLRELVGEPGVEMHLLLDPACGSTEEFLGVLRGLLCDGQAAPGTTAWQMKEDIKNALFRKGVDQGLTVALVVDEAQKITPGALEVLRELLNYETNDSKLLQIILLAQNEFQEALDAAPNLADRVNSLFRLEPLGLDEMRTLVRHRMRCAAGGANPPEIFTRGGYKALFRASGGYPRRIIRLCHKVMLALVMQNSKRANARVVRACVRGDQPAAGRAVGVSLAWSVAALAAGVAAFVVFRPALPPSVVSFAEKVVMDVTALIAPAPPAPIAPVVVDAPASVAPAVPVHGAVPEQVVPEHGAVPEQAPHVQLPAPSEPVVPVAAAQDGQPLAEAAFVLPSGSETAPAAFGTDSAVVAEPLDVVAKAMSTAPRAPRKFAPRASAQFDSMGRLDVGRGETLSSIIHGVYGRYREVLVDEILAFNPGMGDPGLLEAGSRVRLPRIGAVAHRYWLQVDECMTLADAWAVRRGVRALGLDVRVVPFSDAAGEQRYAVALRGLYATEAEALEARAASAKGAMLTVASGQALLPPE